MSTTATLSALRTRPESFLPAIKCSSCGDEVDIAALGDHVCGKTASTSAVGSQSAGNPYIGRQINPYGHTPHAPSPLHQQSQPTTPVPQTRVRAPTLSSSSIHTSKSARPPVPRINPNVANLPFLMAAPGPASPVSPAMSVRSGDSNGSRPPPQRKMSCPGPRLFDPRPPSPELSANMDCAFPPFPITRPGSSGSGGRPSSSNGRNTPPSRGGSRQSPRLGERKASNLGPKSPMSNAGEHVLARMNTLKSGPFDPSRRRPSEHGDTSSPLDRRRPSLSSLKLSNEPPHVPSEPVPRPSTSHTNQSQLSRPLPDSSCSTATRELHPMQAKEQPKSTDRTTQDLLLPGLLEQISAGPFVELPSIFSPSQPPVPSRSVERSQTFPLQNDGGDAAAMETRHALNKTPSEPQLRGRQRRPTLTTSQSEPSQVPQARQRSLSRSGPRIDHRLRDAPPVPKPVLYYRKERMHSPSGSGSSTASSLGSLAASGSSNGPSPVGSEASSIDTFSPLSYESSQYVEEASMQVPSLKVRDQQKPGMRAEQPIDRSTPRNFARLSPPKHIALPQRAPVIGAVFSSPFESPMAPALQPAELSGTSSSSLAPEGRPSLARTSTMPNPAQRQGTPAFPAAEPSHPAVTARSVEYDPYRTSPQSSPRSSTRARSKSVVGISGASLRARSPQPVPPPMPQQTSRSVSPQYKPFDPGTSRSLSPQDATTPSSSQGRTITGAKPTCRGCSTSITGKSVKAADGRLTGRWHKSCFTCTTCAQPFTTADFYVIANQPYCEQHYHEANNSLCHGCHRGIEGQYLETTSSSTNGSVEKKFHPKCFTCCECRQVLAEDYFEFGGRTYCERHALAAMRGQAKVVVAGLGVPDRRAMTAERRTTRLMVMS
ncbi:hypothetical protein BAUCODRAFT_395922 [Baudoinia panamericana UAMH 10762]|uniref:LIM zinc-binding domain-containing protein n=1 Tax=Baudoinia panamericana (strain UAMH 10762) TaxID=717646 RepID=M2MQX9_BAUPA|nr:uncharacterized protein BAUCODRAFT_395922 [Baudoinia panamericana UAMH 10762]EMC99241.1 hypothetical protein BAUCODRAFT_395922 [Baudoinia panamericana UAMH 10762]